MTDVKFVYEFRGVNSTSLGVNTIPYIRKQKYNGERIIEIDGIIFFKKRKTE